METRCKTKKAMQPAEMQEEESARSSPGSQTRRPGGRHSEPHGKDYRFMPHS